MKSTRKAMKHAIGDIPEQKRLNEARETQSGSTIDCARVMGGRCASISMPHWSLREPVLRQGDWRLLECLPACNLPDQR
jgi:hypothetical protein